MERLVEVIKEGEIIRISEEQALREDLFILRSVLVPEEAPQEVVNFREEKKHPVEERASYSRLERWKAGKSYKNNNVKESLVPNFHWEITKKRRALGMSRSQLAKEIGVSEDDMKTVELGELPRDDFVIISRIENKIGISLRKDNAPTSVSLAELQRAQEVKQKEKEKVSNIPTSELLGDELEILD